MNEIPLSPGLTADSFRAPAEGEDAPDRLLGWYEAVSRGFLQGRVSDDFRTHARRHLVADDVLVRGVWREQPTLGSARIPVATFSSWDKTINVGPGLLPLHMITDVTVSPTHRRRGLLRHLMTEDLQDAADRGLPLAALTVSEGSIYGRFGFGLATRSRHLEVDTTARFALRTPVESGPGRGGVELLEPEEAWPSVSAVFDAFHASTRGSVERPAFYRSILTGAFDFEEGPDRKLRAAVHVDADGTPDGYVLYAPGKRVEGHQSVEVRDLVTLNPTAYLGLWRFLADIDLVGQVTWKRAPVDDPLAWALVDPFVVRTVRDTDLLWVRVLDVATALQARAWGADGEVVLEVEDPLGHAAGRWHVATAGGRATVSRTTAEPALHLAADTLGALYLGGVGVGVLAASGRIVGDAAAVRTWAAMADVGPAPYCVTGF